MTEYYGVCIGGPMEGKRVSAKQPVIRFAIYEGVDRPVYKEEVSSMNMKSISYKHCQVSPIIGVFFPEQWTMADCLNAAFKYYGIISE